MLDIGWTELLLIGIVALIVIGPKDLPGMFHTLGKVMARVRSMSREFSRAMDDAARQSGVGDVSKTLRNVANPSKMGLDAVRDAANPFKDTDKKSVGPNTEALSKERAEAKRKILEASAKKANDRIAAEKAAEAAKATENAPTDTKVQETAKTPAKKTTAKKPTAKKAAAKKPAAKKPAAKKPAAKKPATTKAKATAKKTDG